MNPEIVITTDRESGYVPSAEFFALCHDFEEFGFHQERCDMVRIGVGGDCECGFLGKLDEVRRVLGQQ